MGSALSTFNDYVASTPPVFITGTDVLLNEMQRRGYLLKHATKGADKDIQIQGGQRIQDILILDMDSTFEHYQPNATFTPRITQTATTLYADWRFSVASMAWTDQEVELQVVDGMSADAVKGRFKNLKRLKEVNLANSIVEGMENSGWAIPNKLTMEAQNGSDPNSLLCFINEQTNGLFGEGSADTGTDITTTGGKFSTVLGIDPVQKPKWVPNQVAYGSPSTTATGADVANRNILQAFDIMFLKTKFARPGLMSEYYENPEMYRQVIYCSLNGMRIYEHLLRASQNRFTGANGYRDPSYNGPMYEGIQLEYIEALDNIAAYSNDAQSGYTTEMAGAGTAEDNGPRYYWANHNYLFPVYHTRRYMERKQPGPHPQQPFTTVVYVDTWWNWVCRSRRRQGIVWPNGDVYTA